MKAQPHFARLPFLSRLMLAWHLRHHWRLKHAFPGCYGFVRWAWHGIMTAIRVCRTELMPVWHVLVMCASRKAKTTPSPSDAKSVKS